MAVFKVITEISPICSRRNYGQKYHDEEAVDTVLQYVCAVGKTRQDLIGGFGIDPLYAAEQMNSTAQIYGKTEGIHLRHMVLSFSPDEAVTPFQAKQLAFQIAAYYEHRYQILYAIHLDAAVLNVHFVMNTVSYQDGRKYDGRKADYYRFQEHLRAVLSAHGLSLLVVSDKSERSHFQP